MSTPYADGYHEALSDGARRSARAIMPLVLNDIQPRSIVDVGCGLGTWLSVCKELGVRECLGIDGDHIDRSSLEIKPEEFIPFDLKRALSIERRFDLVLCLEVAEHLPDECASTLVESICRLGPVVLFSAAVPFQGGVDHVNERWPHYWARHFSKRGYVAADYLRKQIWNNGSVEAWYAQNVLLFVEQDVLDRYPAVARAAAETKACRLALVHPGVERDAMAQARAWPHLADALQAGPVVVEVTEPIRDIAAPTPMERLQLAIRLEGEPLGTLELPVADGCVSRYVLGDAVAADFAWRILGSLFERTVYRTLRLERDAAGVTLLRGALRLADALPDALPDDGEAFWSLVHERIGWTVFLQEIWGLPDWTDSHFYDARAADQATVRRRADDGWIVLEVSEELPDVETSGRQLHVELTVGGVALGVVPVPVRRNVVRAQELRATLIAASGFELCRAAVREGVLGRPLTDTAPVSLRARLAAEAALRRGAGARARAQSSSVADLGRQYALRHDLPLGTPGIMLGRHGQGEMGTSTSRRAMLPAGAVDSLLDAAAAAGEAVVYSPGPDKLPTWVAYAPDLLARPKALERSRGPGGFWSGAAVVRSLGRRAVDQGDQIRARLRRLTLPEGHPDRGRADGSGEGPTSPVSHLPILRYRSVSPDDCPVDPRHRVAPDVFETQLGYLRAAGFRSLSLAQWRAAMEAKRPLSGRAVLITFDCGYLDFWTNAWPALRRHEFTALVFLTADEVGGRHSWDHAFGEPVQRLGWPEIRRLRDEGVEFGSHSATHRPLTALSNAEVVREGARSRARLTRGLGTVPAAFAYPYGDVNPVVQHLIGACGYTYGLSCRPEMSGFRDVLLALPRIEVAGGDGVQELAAKLERRPTDSGDDTDPGV